jgi:hypothetical protein
MSFLPNGNYELEQDVTEVIGIKKYERPMSAELSGLVKGNFPSFISKTDETMIQFRMLNRSKGPAMWSPRAQNDRNRFAEEWRLTLEGISNLDFFQDMVSGLIIKGNKVAGVKVGLGMEIHAKAVVLTNGTWTHLTLLQNGTAPVLYVNGQLAAITAHPKSQHTCGNHVKISAALEKRRS